MRVSEIASTDVVTVSAEASADEAIALMEEHEIRHLPVVSDGEPVGIVSDRDLLRSVGWLDAIERTDLHDGQTIGPRAVADIMSSPAITLECDASIVDVATVMLNERIGAVGLVSDRKLQALVTETDVLRCFTDDGLHFTNSSWRFLKVADRMSANVFRLNTNDPILRATRLMREKHVRHIPILANNHVVGMVSDRDIRQACFLERLEWFKDDEPPERLRTNVEHVMTKKPATTLPSATLAEAAARMIEGRFGALPVNDHRQLVGILSESDLLRAFVDAA